MHRYSSDTIARIRTDYVHEQQSRYRNAIADLSSFPSRYPPVLWEPWNGKGLHKLPVDRYVVYYLVNDEEHMVNIVRIFYGGRDAERLLQEPH